MTKPLQDLDAFDWRNVYPDEPGWWAYRYDTVKASVQVHYLDETDIKNYARRHPDVGAHSWAPITAPSLPDPITDRVLPALRSVLGAHIEDDDSALADAVVSLVEAKCRADMLALQLQGRIVELEKRNVKLINELTRAVRGRFGGDADDYPPGYIVSDGSRVD